MGYPTGKDDAPARQPLDKLLGDPLRQLMDQLPAAMYVCEAPSGIIRFFNEEAARLWGREPETGDAAQRFSGCLRMYRLDGTPLPLAESPMAEVLCSGRSRKSEVVIERPDGSQRTLRCNVSGLRDDAGRLIGAVDVFEDVTYRKSHENDAGRLAAIVDSADDAIVSKTLDGIITSWNRGAERMFGYSSDEAVGQPITMIIPRERLHEEQDILRRLQQGGKLQHFETERVRKDGSRIEISLSVSPVLDAEGRVIGASKIARDVTVRKRAEAELRASRNELERRLRQLQEIYELTDSVARAGSLEEIYDHALTGLIDALGADRAGVLCDESGVMRFKAWRGLSEGFRRATEGHSPWPRESTSWSPILVPDAASDPRVEPLRAVLRETGIAALAFIPLVHHGQLLGRLMLYHDAPQRFTDEEVQVAQTIAGQVAFAIARQRTDAERERLLVITDRALAKAESANRAKDEFLAMLAHELRNPLAVIGNACAVLQRVGSPLPEAERLRTMIVRQTSHLARLLDDLLDVARITSGRIEMQSVPVDLSELTRLTLEAQRHRLEAKGQRLAVSLPEVPLFVVGDAARLQQVLGNLLDNACKYTPEGGSIALGLGVEDGDVVLRLRDDGVGIPRDELETIFELFYQARPTLARTEGGLGIGLTLVKRVVELHGGSVEAVSEGPERGSEFVVRLPAATRLSVTPAPPGEPRAPARRILLVEDHVDGREALAALLRLDGHVVLQAATGADGIALALEHEPDVVLVDIGLPDLDGYEVCRRLREQFGNRLRIFAVTGYGQPEDRERVTEAGFDAHLVKPASRERLARLLAEEADRP